MRKAVALFMACAVVLALAGTPAQAAPPARTAAPATVSAAPFIANYAATMRETEPRADGIRHVDTPAMIRRLQQLHVTTYWYLVWYTTTEWQDFITEFRPAAERAGIDVYIYLVPPSECQPVCSAPYNTDFVRWGEEIAALSVKHPHIKGWAIDDFIYSTTTLFTPDYVGRFVNAARAINPALRFYAQVYHNNLSPEFAAVYTPLVDGFVLAYRDDPYRNTQVTDSLRGQLETDLDLVRQYGKSLVLMVYGANLSNTPMPPSASYVDTVVRTGLEYLRAGKLAGVVTYVLKMDGQQERPADFNHARSGVGALSLFEYLSQVNGGFAEASQRVTVEPGREGEAAYGLDFAAGLRVLSNASYGQQQLQVLIDGQVAWQINPATLPKGSYTPVHVDLTPYLRGKTSATLTIRLATIVQAHFFIVAAVVDDLAATGFTVANPGFEDRSGWALARSGPEYVPDFDLFDPDRGRGAFAAVGAQYGPHGLVIRVDALNLPAAVKWTMQIVAWGARQAYLAGQRHAAATLARILAGQARFLGQNMLAEQADAVAAELSVG